MVGDTITLTTSGNFGTSSSINNDTSSLQIVISDLCMRKKIVLKLCVSIGHNTHACIIRCPKFLPQSLRITMNKLYPLHGEELN